MSFEVPCAACGAVHAPIDPSRRYFYATRPDSPEHAGEIEWFAKHGVHILHKVTRTEALLLGMAEPEATARLLR